MREILFRGKSKKHGKWVYGGYYILPDGKGGAIHRIAESNCELFEYSDVVVDEHSVSEFTGLTDKNGKKIFEGDICIVKENGESDYATVGFEHGAFVIYPVNGKITEKTLWDVWYNDFSIEVIGNIHDNFELFNNSELLEDKL